MSFSLAISVFFIMLNNLNVIAVFAQPDELVLISVKLGSEYTGLCE
jgi:hypothetical protein